MFGTFLILVGLSLALDSRDLPAQAGEATGAAGRNTAIERVPSPLREYIRGIERPLPSRREIDRLAEMLSLDEAGRSALSDAVAAAISERREAVARTLGGPEATAVLTIVDSRGGRPDDEALMAVASQIVNVGRSLRDVDEAAHRSVWQAIQSLATGPLATEPPATWRDERLADAERYLRRVRLLGVPAAAASEHRRDQSREAGEVGAGIDLLALCRESERLAGGQPSLASLLRQFDDAASIEPTAVLAALGRDYARDVDNALRSVERHEAGVPDAAERAVTMGDRALWDAALTLRADARRAAARVCEATADAIASIIARERSVEEAWVWRHEVRCAAHPGLFPDEPVARLRDWAMPRTSDAAATEAMGVAWREYLAARDQASTLVVRLHLDGAGRVGAPQGSAGPHLPGATGRLRSALAARASLDEHVRQRMLALLPPDVAAHAADAVRWPGSIDATIGLGSNRRSDVTVAREVGEVHRETQGD